MSDVVVLSGCDYNAASLLFAPRFTERIFPMKQLRKASSLLIIVGLFCGAVVGQNREKFVISAKAGGVNSVLGRVNLQKKGLPQPELLNAQTDLAAGDVVDTGRSGRVEILLNPGSYLRAAEGTRFELTDNSLEHLTVTILQGSAIVEATGANDVNTEIAINTPHSRTALVKRGIYRFNVTGQQTELLVLKGKAIVNGNESSPVRGGQKAMLTSGPVVTAKLNKKDQDDFDSWSRNRAELLARANSRISARALNSYLSSLDNDWSLMSYAGHRHGLWLYNGRSMCYTFMPFYSGWGSPYGPGYASQFYWYGDPWSSGGRYPIIVNGDTTRGPGPYGNGNSGSGGSGGSGIGPSGNGSGGSGPGASPARPVSVDVDRSGPRGKNIEPSDPNRP
jgi:hypothetical protein